MRRRRPLHGYHVKHSQFSSPLTNQRNRKHVTVTATSSPLGRHVELALKDTEHAQNESIPSAGGSHRAKHQGSGSESNDSGGTGRLFRVYDESSPIYPNDDTAHDRYQSGDGPPPPSAVKTRRPLNNVSNHTCTSTFSPCQNISASSAKSLDKSKKWEERMLDIGLKTTEAHDNSPVMSVKNSGGFTGGKDFRINDSILLDKNVKNTTLSAHSSLSDADNNCQGVSADYVQFDVHALHYYRGSKLSPKSQGGLFSPSSRDEYPNFNGGVKEDEPGRDCDDFCGNAHDKKVINFHCEGLESKKNKNDEFAMRMLDVGNHVYLPERESGGKISGDLHNIDDKEFFVDTDEDVASLQVKGGIHDRSGDSCLGTFALAKIEEVIGDRKSPSGAGVRAMTSKPPLYQGDVSTESSPSFTTKRSYLYQSALGSMGSNSDSSSVEIAECVADIADQSSSMKTRGQISETSSNVTKEIAECVADVIDQPISKFQCSETNSTVEIAECVADIMEQSIASSTLMESIESRNKFCFTSCSSIEEKRYSKSSDHLKRDAISVQHHQLDGDSDTQTTTEIAECVADLLEQTMAADGLMEVIQDQVGDSKRRAISSLSPNMNSKDSVHRHGATSDEGQKLSFPHTNIIKQMQKERVARLLQAMTSPPPPPPPLPPPTGGNDPHVTNPLTGTNCETSPFDSFSLSDSSCSTPSDKISTSDINSIGAYKNPSYHREIINARQDISNTIKTRISSTQKKQFASLSANASRYMSSGSYSDALNSFQHLLKCQVSALGEANPLVASSYHNIGIVYTKCALVAKSIVDEEMCNALALQSFQDAASVARQALGPNHPNVAVSLVRIGLILLQAGHYSEAIVTFQECLRIRQNALGGEHFLVARVFNNLGVAHLHIDDYELSLKEFESACSIHRLALDNILKECNNDTTDVKVCQAELELADSLSNIGSICLDWVEKNGESNHLNKQSDLCKKAVTAFNEAISLRINHLGKEHELVQDLEQMKLDADQMLKLGPRGDSPDIRTAVSILAISRDKTVTEHHNDTTSGKSTVPLVPKSSSSHFLDEESCLMSKSRIGSSISPWDESSITSSKSASTSHQTSQQILVMRPIEHDATSSLQSIQSKDNDAPSIKGVDEWDPFENGAVDENLEIPSSPVAVVQQSSKAAFDSFDASLAHVHQASEPGNGLFDGVQLGKADSLYNVSFRRDNTDDKFKSDPPNVNLPHAKAPLSIPMHRIQRPSEPITTSSISERQMLLEPEKYSSQIQLLAYQYLKVCPKFLKDFYMHRIHLFLIIRL